jgi:hypothetical protein
VSANRAEGLPSREIMRRGTLWLTGKGLGRISLPIWAVKMEIPVKTARQVVPAIAHGPAAPEDGVASVSNLHPLHRTGARRTS